MSNPQNGTNRTKTEKRFAVVMYGGISLAIYINGVAQELFNLVKSTSEAAETEELSGTAAVYKKIAKCLGTKFVVDILSGTSAGGINAIHLAKALANNQDFSALKNLWVDEGDINVLLNDKKSQKDTKLARRKKAHRSPASILNGYRMYEKLEESFNIMDERKGASMVDELDLFIPTTDLQGNVMSIRMANDVAEERQHRQVFHFKKLQNLSHDLIEPKGFLKNTIDLSGYKDLLSTNDFQGKNELLALAARCTSSFPMAFEPVRVIDLIDFESEKQVKDFFEELKLHLKKLPEDNISESPRKFLSRAYADGGYLDNKPFSYAIDAMAARHADVPVDRKLIYIEPSPEKLDAAEDVNAPPNAFTNTMSAVSISLYETIQQDLVAIRKRNRLVERTVRILRGTEDDIFKNNLLEQDTGNQGEQGEEVEQPLTVNSWLQADLKDLIEKEGTAYASYFRLRVAHLTDDITQIIATQTGYNSDSDHFLAIRYLVRSWRERSYKYYGCFKEIKGDPKGQERCFNHFIISYDIDFHVRRLSFIISRIDLLLNNKVEALKICESRRMDPEILNEDAFKDRLEELRSKLSLARKKMVLLRVYLPLSKPEKWELSDALGESYMNSFLESATEEERDAKAENLIDCYPEALPEILEWIGNHVEEVNEIARACKVLVGLRKENCDPEIEECDKKWINVQPSDNAETAAWIVRYYYRFFPRYDLTVYPILQTAGLGEELDQVEIIRVSPADRSKLGGAKLGSFGAFMDKEWRENDIIHGRLDGATSIISALYPREDQKECRDKAIHEAKVAILTEAFPDPSNKLKVYSKLFNPEGELEPKDKQLIENFLKGNPDPDGFKKMFEAVYTIKQRLEGEFVTTTMSRTVKVFGKMLDRIAEEYRTDGSKTNSQTKGLAKMLVATGTIGTRLVDVAMPNRWWYILGRRLRFLLLGFALVNISIGLFFGLSSTALIGLGLVGVLAISHLILASVEHFINRNITRFFLSISVYLLGIFLCFTLFVGVANVPQTYECMSNNKLNIREACLVEYWDKLFNNERQEQDEGEVLGLYTK